MLQLERAFTYVGCEKENRSSTGARLQIMFTHLAPTQQTTNKRFRESARAQLVFNAFWNIQHFCVHQMLMRDPMHQIDLGAIVHLIRAILRNFQECAEIALDKVGLAAALKIN